MTVALVATDRAQIDRRHAIAPAHGGTDDGGPGERGSGFHAACFRDPDGNRLDAFVMD